MFSRLDRSDVVLFVLVLKLWPSSDNVGGPPRQVLAGELVASREKKQRDRYLIFFTKLLSSVLKNLRLLPLDEVVHVIEKGA